MKTIRFFKWLIVFDPQTEVYIPDKWQVATRHRIFGIEFVLWEL